LDNKNIEYRFRIGQALAENGFYEESAKHLKSVIKASKNGDVTLKAKKEMAHTSGKILIQKKQYQKAYNHYRDSERLYKSEFNIDIAEALILLKKYDDAEKLLSQLSEHDSQNFRAHGLLSRVYKEKGNIKKHLLHLDKAWMGIPGESLKDSTIVNLGLKDGFDKLKTKTWGDAIIAFNRVLNHDPNNLYAVIGKHVALQNSGNIKVADALMSELMNEKEKTVRAKINFLEVRSLVSQ
ncbi:MAG: tetratricopeptide repeat protein, partial [Gammaproteobacteria bacterium]|nr:tetratricopeptide repeat protein [Gammaproteobacteria bacterium]